MTKYVIHHPQKIDAEAFGLRFVKGQAEIDPMNSILFDAHPGKSLDEILGLLQDNGFTVIEEGVEVEQGPDDPAGNNAAENKPPADEAGKITQPVEE